MKKYLVFVFLLGLIPFSFLNLAKAMEAMEVDREDPSSNSVPIQKRRYVVSPEEDEKPLTIYKLRKLYPITHLNFYDDLDKILYRNRCLKN